MRSRAASQRVLSRSSSASSSSASARCGSISSARVAAAAAAGGSSSRERAREAGVRRRPFGSSREAPAGTTSPPRDGCISRGTAAPTPVSIAGIGSGLRQRHRNRPFASRARPSALRGAGGAQPATPDPRRDCAIEHVQQLRRVRRCGRGAASSSAELERRIAERRAARRRAAASRSPRRSGPSRSRGARARQPPRDRRRAARGRGSPPQPASRARCAATRSPETAGSWQPSAARARAAVKPSRRKGRERARPEDGQAGAASTCLNYRTRGRGKRRGRCDKSGSTAVTARVSPGPSLQYPVPSFQF